MSKLSDFLNRKDIVISFKRYGQEALSAMAIGLFSSLLVGLILKTAGQQLMQIEIFSSLGSFLIEIGTMAMNLMGGAIGVAIAWALKAPPLVLFASMVTGTMGATMTSSLFAVAGGPAGAFVAVLLACEIGKAVSKETKVDIIVTPVVTILTGAVVAKAVSPIIGMCMKLIGEVVSKATELQPFLMGIAVATIVGLALTAPISSVALCIMLDISGLAAGAAVAGCCGQMIGFAAMTYKENGVGGAIAQGLGTSMLQISNILKNWWILLPPTVASGICGALSTCVFNMRNGAVFAGMGTSGLVGQIGAITVGGYGILNIVGILIVHIFVPTVVSIALRRYLEIKKKIKMGDGTLEL